jgi:acyl carrier protein
MTRDQVLAVVSKHLLDAVDGLTPEKFDPKLSMKDLGANSLDIVEIVSASMRELKVKIPRAELVKIANIDGLVDLLHKTITTSTGTAAKAS